MAKYNAKELKFRKLICIYRATKYASGIRACYKYDSRVKSFIERMPEGFDICVGVNGQSHMVVITKIADGLHCRVVSDYVMAKDSVMMLLKNIKSAEEVLTNRKSFLQAHFEQGLIMRGEVTNAIDFINMFMVIQSYMASQYKRKTFLGDVLAPEVSRSKVRAHVLFKGWLL